MATWGASAADGDAGDWIPRARGASYESEYLTAAFRRGLAENGYVDGQNLILEYRWAEGQYDRPALRRELVRRSVAVLFAASVATRRRWQLKPPLRRFRSSALSGERSGQAAGSWRANNRPGGNITGMSILTPSSLEPKRLGLLRELVPQATTLGSHAES